ncbi:glycerate kinase family protein [Anaerotignum sp.]|uniref:glycerate kinase family protein n=1 Tax=Anaerotignum sp. TaxID=2039241 RepID=UPI0029DE21E5|nr:glycerate kinase [Anaerotignum sp.]MCI6057878.1 glycerate kinase [Clostridia bacterium]MDY3596648.1 glycerate kinase [Anaerotignum sp.]
MKIVVAIDSFKGSLSSLEAGTAIKNGIHLADPSADIHICPLADGGEGTLDALVQSLGGEKRSIQVTGPLGESVEAKYGILSDQKTAILETASAAGLTLVPEEKRNPLHTTSFGIGEMIKDAISQGCRQFIVGLGGSATNDGGIGMLQALGFELLDASGQPVPFGAKGLENFTAISHCNVLPELADCQFQIACDVKNPLYGNDGCSYVFGPQKGATPTMAEKMDQWMIRYAQVVKKAYPEKAHPLFSGAGAAGGLGFAFLTFTNATLASGIQIILEQIGAEALIQDADLVITGEGKLDEQTAMGKAPMGIASLAKKYSKPVIAFSGCASHDAGVCNKYGIDAFFPILRSPCTLAEAMKKEIAAQNLTDTAEQVYRLWQIRPTN